MHPIQSQQLSHVRPIALSKHDSPSTDTLPIPQPYIANHVPYYQRSRPPLTHDSPQFHSVLTDMPSTRKAFRSLRSFTHAGRHRSTASEIVSDPIVDDELAPTPERTNLARKYRNASSDEVIVDPDTPIKQQELPPRSSNRDLSVRLRRSSPLTFSVPHSSSENDTNLNQFNSSIETQLLRSNLAPQQRPSKSSSFLSAPRPTSADHEIIQPHVSDAQRFTQPNQFLPRHGIQATDSANGANLPLASPLRSHTAPHDASASRMTRSRARHTQQKNDGATRRAKFEEALQPICLEEAGSNRDTRNKEQRVVDLDEVVEAPESPAIKRRRTRSSTCRNGSSSASPEVDVLHLRQIVDNATDEGRKAILAASGSSRGRRKLHQLFIHDKEDDLQPAKGGSVSNVPKDGDVEWLGTSYDSVEEVVPTPSPRSKRKRRSHRHRTSVEINRSRTKPKQTLVERIDTSASPERIMRRRSRRLDRDNSRVTRSATQDRIVETIDSSSSPGPKTGRSRRRRSRRLEKVADLHSAEKGVDSDDSDHSESSGERVIEHAVRSRRAKHRNEKSRSRPLPIPKAGVLQDRLRRRKPILPIRRKPSRNLRKEESSHAENSIDGKPPSLRRSTRLRGANSRTGKHSVVDVDADDEVLAEGSASNENEVHGSCSSAEEEAIVEEVEDEDEEDDDEVPLGDDEDDEGDNDDDGDDDNFEERAWKEQLKRKQLRRKRRRNGRRKRTQPRDVFRTEGEFLTAREQKERLDFLVKQSADIASHLHEAMADASKRSATSTGVAQAQSSGSATLFGEKETKEEGGGLDVPEGANRDTDKGRLEGNTDATRNEETFVPPSGLGCELQPHQQEGVDWLLTLDAQGLNAILADEMGLGKTIQAVSFLASLVLSGSRGPHLVVAPKNVCEHWADEVRKWYPKELTVVTHLGHAEDRLERLKHVLEEDNFDILITSFDHALRDLFTRRRSEGISWEHVQVRRAFRKVEFEYLVVDEAHRLKNDSSKLNLAIRSYSLAQRRLLLTGTPLSNNLRELWSLMNVLNPRIFSSKTTFEAWFSAPFASKTKKHAKVSLTHAEQSVVVDRLHTVIRPFFRRRIRADVCPTFTSADEVVIRCPLSALQLAVTLHFQRRAATSEAGINNVIMAMRAASNHPYIVSDALFDSEQALAAARLVGSSGKFVFLHFALPRLVKSGHRILIFSQFKRVLDFIEDLLIILSLKFGRLDGGTTSDDRRSGLTEFNREGSDIPIFLLTTRAGGIGLNLQTADTVILFDSDWNPSADLQAVSRIQRIGQKKTVHILRLVTEKSVDDLIVETARQKLRTQNVAVGAGKFNTSLGAALDIRMRQKDLEELLKRLEAQNYLGDHQPTAQSASQENGSPESLSPLRVSRTAQNRRFEEWSNQLLRKGESALSSVDIAPIWVDNPTDNSSDSCIPRWLAKDADLRSAAKALSCADVSSASRVYEESVLSKAETGAYSKKDRAVRARRQISVIDISDADSENGTDGSSARGDPSVDPGNYSEPESDYEVSPDEEKAKEKPIPQKSEPRGLLQGWTGTQISHVPFGSTDPALIASTLMGSSEVYNASNPSQPAPNDGAVRAIPRAFKRTINEAVHVNAGTNEAPVATITFQGLPYSNVVPSTNQKPPVSTQDQFLQTRWVSTGPSGVHTESRVAPSPPSSTLQTRRSATGVPGNRKRVWKRRTNGASHKESGVAPQTDKFWQDKLSRESLSVPGAPAHVGSPSVGRSWESQAPVAYTPVRRAAFRSTPLPTSQGGFSVKSSESVLPVFGQPMIVTSTATPILEGNQMFGSPSVRAKEVSKTRSGKDPVPYRAQPVLGQSRPAAPKLSSGAKMSNSAHVTDSALPPMSVSKKFSPRQPIVATFGDVVEIASSSEFDDDIRFNSRLTVEEAVSIRPVFSRRASSKIDGSGKHALVDYHRRFSRERGTDVQGPRKAAKPSKDRFAFDAAAAVRSARRVEAEQFASQVERLKVMTNVADTELLVDALLECDCDTDSAKEFVLRRRN